MSSSGSSSVAASTDNSITTEQGDRLLIVHDLLDEGLALRHVRDPSAGATCVFVGTTRDSFKGTRGQDHASQMELIADTATHTRSAGKTVTRLEYEAYSTLALRTMRSIVQRARKGQLEPPVQERAANASDAGAEQKYGTTLTRIFLAHRLGTVPVGESSIIVAVSSPHRRESFEVAEWLLEQVKREVPIWKQEQYADEADGAARPEWKANFPPSSTVA